MCLFFWRFLFCSFFWSLKKVRESVVVLYVARRCMGGGFRLFFLLLLLFVRLRIFLPDLLLHPHHCDPFRNSRRLFIKKKDKAHNPTHAACIVAFFFFFLFSLPFLPAPPVSPVPSFVPLPLRLPHLKPCGSPPFQRCPGWETLCPGTGCPPACTATRPACCRPSRSPRTTARSRPGPSGPRRTA